MLTTAHFTYDAKTKTLSAEASDLHTKILSNVIHIMDDDSDLVIQFKLRYKTYQNGDGLVAWEYFPMNEQIGIKKLVIYDY